MSKKQGYEVDVWLKIKACIEVHATSEEEAEELAKEELSDYMHLDVSNGPVQDVNWDTVMASHPYEIDDYE